MSGRLDGNVGRFERVTLDEEQQRDSEFIRQQAEALELALEAWVPEGRYQSLALTHLETAIMYATKGISRRNV